MNDLILKGAVKMDMARMRVMDRVTNKNENGDIVQTIIIIAMFVLICMVVGGILMTAINGQATKVGECISNSNSGKCTNFKK
jgi:hypothetical protein